MIWKTVHKKFLSLLSYSTPLTILVFILCITLLLSSSAVLFVGLLQTITFGYFPYTPSGVTAQSSFGLAQNSYDNLHGRPFLDSDLNPFPIDVVYTWVNGSDARMQRDIAEFKARMGLDTQEEEENEDAQVDEAERERRKERNRQSRVQLLLCRTTVIVVH